MQGIAQLLMLGVGGFVLWQWYSSRQSGGDGSGTVTPGGGSSTTLPAGGGSGSSTPGGSTQPGGGGSTTTTSPQLTVAQITPLAAGGNREWAAVLDQRNIRYNVDQWNWYREQGGLLPIAPEEMEILILPEEDRQEPLLASEYLARLQRLSVGMSGLGNVWAT